MKLSSLLLASLMLAVYLPAAHADKSEEATESASIACTDKDDGDACEFTNSSGESANGACHYAPGGTAKLVCVQYKAGD
jgi:hypothetical protein